MEETSKQEFRGKKPMKERKPMKEKPAKEKEDVKKPAQTFHPSWEAQKENREKQKLHIDANAPKQNTSIVFD